jgi:hypothetical protein
VTLAQATAELGFATDAYARRLVKAGTLRAKLVNGRYNVDPASVAEYMERVEQKRSARVEPERPERIRP